MSQPQFWQDFQVLPVNRISFDRVIPPFSPDLILVNGFISRYLGADVVSLTFNGDNAANYYDATLALTAAGGALLTNTPDANSNKIRLGLPTTKGRSFQLVIGCALGTTRLVLTDNQIGSGDIANPPIITTGSVGEWNNTTDPVKFLDFITDTAHLMGAGSSLLCQFYGRG